MFFPRKDARDLVCSPETGPFKMMRKSSTEKSWDSKGRFFCGDETEANNDRHGGA
jgi:hypothetical protein